MAHIVRKRTSLVCALVFNGIVFGCAEDGSARRAPVVEPLQEGREAGTATSAGVVRLEPFRSTLTGTTYPVDVYLPTGYGADAAGLFPVIYATDAQWAFDGFAREIESRELDVVLVGVHDAGQREQEYLLPQAKVYVEFLTTELIPWIESEFRVDAQQRTLVGTSYGGVLVACALLLDDVETPHFAQYLAFDGSFYEHPGDTGDLLKARFAQDPKLNATLVLTRATVAPSNEAVVLSFGQQVENQGFVGLTMLTHALAVDHYQVSDPSFRYVLDTLF